MHSSPFAVHKISQVNAHVLPGQISASEAYRRAQSHATNMVREYILPLKVLPSLERPASWGRRTNVRGITATVLKLLVHQLEKLLFSQMLLIGRVQYGFVLFLKGLLKLRCTGGYNATGARTGIKISSSENIWLRSITSYF